MLAERLYCFGGQFQDAPALAGLGVTLDRHGAVHGHRAGLEINLVPRDRPGLLGADPGQQGQHHVGREPVTAGLDGLQERDGLAQGHGLRRPAFLPLRDVDQARDVAPYLVTGLALPDRTLNDLVY